MATVLVTAEQAEAILDAARVTGMDDAKLWELAQLLGVEPEEHDIPTLEISMTAFESLEESPSDWGIPAMAFDRWNRLLEVADDEDYCEDKAEC